MPGRGRDGGQAAVEVAAMIPLLVVVVLGAAQALAAGVGAELAGHAAENGALAVGAGEDPRAAVRDALPGWARERVRVTVRGRRIGVTLMPVTVLPGAGRVLAAHAEADAGPPAPEAGVAGAADDRGRGR